MTQMNLFTKQKQTQQISKSSILSIGSERMEKSMKELKMLIKNACFIAVKAGLENPVSGASLPGAAGLGESVHVGCRHLSLNYFPKLPGSISDKPLTLLVFGCRFLQCLFSSADNIRPCFSSTVLDLFSNIFVISLKSWDRQEVNVRVSFSLHYSIDKVTRICVFFSFLPHTSSNVITIKKTIICFHSLIYFFL